MSVAVDIFVVSCKAVLKVFIIGGVGCFARRRGLLDEDSCRKMAKLNGAVFLPCLLFVALGRSVTIDHLRNVWLLPLSACVNIALGAVMGKALVRALGTPPEFRGAAVASAAFGNSLALPVVLIAAVVGAGDVGDVSFGEDAQAESILYLGAYMTTLTVLMWTIGPVWMREGTRIAAGEKTPTRPPTSSCASSRTPRARRTAAIPSRSSATRTAWTTRGKPAIASRRAAPEKCRRRLRFANG